MNLLAGADRLPKALLALDDGTVFAGRSCGAEGETFGEIVFNTSMVGYQEIATDPSYAGQIVTFTYPQVGNYGVNAVDMQADTLALRGIVVHDMCFAPSNWQCVQSFPDYLSAYGVVAIEGVDTRALTLRIREGGAMRAAISTRDLDPGHLVARVRESPSIADHNYVADVSTTKRYRLPATGRERSHVVAFDCGEKRGITKRLAVAGCAVTVVPWDTPADEALALKPDGIFFSNGPGDPQTVGTTAEAVRQVLGTLPVFGICLGNQLLTIAAGGAIEKLSYGHHGGNEPVMNLLTGLVEITAQNHNYGPVFPTLGPLVPELSGGISEHVGDLRLWSRRHIAPVVMNERYGRIRLTHVNLNDGTPEGLQFLDVPAFSMQYHPEAKPGPNDASYAFEAFCRLMEGRDDYLAIDVREGRAQ
ncbi:carbamoyl-phosphate synthase small subunit [Olsenella profusa DSM 13989]|uniref:glutamine-hydrolyzing carbamoyl-phosphate synthase small subunit n=1 Tax=Olsenella profusa TaxID=138595 RepID=UPI00278BA0C9|nr:glutamine-hydrolyzing carbamoyl-phosphate synthase small subunit [Olsenella profusa]MDP9860521.1 carbamoyl-phosphate synthase small subunit [Olsenella profusa DSM 13989]